MTPALSAAGEAAEGPRAACCDGGTDGGEAARWSLLAERFAFLGNSLLSPMAKGAASGLDPAFWDAFEEGLEGACPQGVAPDARRALDELRGRALGADADDAERAEAVQRVNVEHARLFLGPPKPAAPPWETLYARPGEVGEVGFGRAAVDMRHLLRDAGLALSNENNQYADHMGVELLFAAELCRRAAAGEGDAEAVRGFLREHPLAWAPAFADRVAEAAPHGYFAPLARLVCELCAAAAEEESAFGR